MTEKRSRGRVPIAVSSAMAVLGDDRLRAIMLYVAMSLALTWPTILHLNTVVFGLKTDVFYNVWSTWWRKFSLLHGEPYYFQHMLSAPFGTDQVVPGYSALYLMLAGMAMMVGEVAAVNLATLLAIVLCGYLTYMIAKRVIGDEINSLIAGAIFAFSPFMLINTQHNVDLAQVWVISLFILALLHFREQPSPLRAAAVGAAFGFSFLMNPYYGYQTAVAGMASFVMDAAVLIRSRNWEDAGKLTGRYAMIGIAGVVVALPDLIPALQSTFVRPKNALRIDNLLTQSADWPFYTSTRPWDLVLPPPQHPVLGDLALNIRLWIRDIPYLDFVPPIMRKPYPTLYQKWWWVGGAPLQGRGAGETYLGLVVLGLAIYGWWAGRQTQGEARSQPERKSIHFLVVVFVVALLFSQPPYLPIGAVVRRWLPALHNIVIPMPSLLTSVIAPPLREVGRFVVLMDLPLAVLAGRGMFEMQKRIDRRWARWGAAAVVSGLLVFDYAQPMAVSSWAVPEAYQWLADQDGVENVAYYPWNSHEQAVYQYVYERPTVNVLARPHSPVDNLAYIKWITLGEMVSPSTVGKLAALGTTHVVNGTGDSMAEVDRLEKVFEEEGLEVLAISATPTPLVILQTPRGDLWRSAADWSWQADRFEITVWNPLNESTLVAVRVMVNAPVDGALLTLERTLTPHPGEIVWKGQLGPNPFAVDDTSYAVLNGVDEGNAIVFEGVEMKRGETTIDFVWDAGDHPAVMDVEFVLAR